MQGLLGRTRLGQQGEFGARQEQAQVIVGGQQPAARVALEPGKAAGRPEILHGAIVSHRRKLLVRYIFDSYLRLLDMGQRPI